MDRDDDIKKLETLPRANLEALQLDAFRGLLGQQGEYKRHIGAAAALAGLGRKLVVDAALLALYLCRCGVAT